MNDKNQTQPVGKTKDVTESAGDDVAVQGQAKQTNATEQPSSDKPVSSGTKEINGAKKINGVKEINGPKGLEPTRYGDWESKGRCYDF